MGRGWWYKTLWETALSEVPYFWERSNFPRIWFQDLRFRIWGLKINHLNAHNFMLQECFFFHYYLATSTTNWAQIFTGLLFNAYVETGPNSIELLKHKILHKQQNPCLVKSDYRPRLHSIVMLSKQRLNTSHKQCIWHEILASNISKTSKLFSCLSKFCA